MNFINGNGICKRKPVQLDITVKDLVHICVRHMEDVYKRQVVASLNEDDEKIVYLPTNASYQIKLTATDLSLIHI